MAEQNKTSGQAAVRQPRHRGRESQVLIYLGKQLRFFINENDWKVLPMAAIIAALVGMVIRKRFFINMEGSLIGAFALTCVAIWNGCFNSIQSVCRERAIVKREHRSGMYVSSYVLAHMIYQLMLCILQTGLSMYVMQIIGVQFPTKGFMTPFMILDIGITMLLISYAADMLSLFVSSVSHTTTGAMTVMPFVLIFQLVFSGGVIPLPEWSRGLSNFTISNYGIRAIAAQSGYNELPMVTGWNTLVSMRDNEIGGDITVGQLLDLLDSPAVQKRRDMPVITQEAIDGMVDAAARALLPSADPDSGTQSGTDTPDGATAALAENTEKTQITLGQIADFLRGSQEIQSIRDEVITVKGTVGDIFDLFGEEKVKTLVQEKTVAAIQNP